MALQTKVFSSATTSNGFTLALTITENSTSIDGNTSSVSYSLALKSGGWNFAQWRIGWSISLGGTVVSSQSKSSAPQFTLGTNSSITIASGTTTVAHNSDGTKSMSVAASIDMTKASYTQVPCPCPAPGHLQTSLARHRYPLAVLQSDRLAQSPSTGPAHLLPTRCLTHLATPAALLSPKPRVHRYRGLRPRRCLIKSRRRYQAAAPSPVSLTAAARRSAENPQGLQLRRHPV